jgi:hypothetical protein
MKKSQNSRYKGIHFYFCLMKEGSVSGSVPLWLMDLNPGGPKLTGPDPEHYLSKFSWIKLFSAVSFTVPVPSFCLKMVWIQIRIMHWNLKLVRIRNTVLLFKKYRRQFRWRSRIHSSPWESKRRYSLCTFPKFQIAFWGEKINISVT